MAKSRIAPRDKITLPRLELMAALLAARLRTFIVARLDVKIDRVFHYADSVVVFYWCIAEDRSRWKAFVCNRVVEIQQHSSREEWFHVVGTKNVADIASRGISADGLGSSAEWWHAPSWCSEPRERRPVRRLRSGCDNSESASQELRLMVTPVDATPLLIDLERLGSLEKAVRVLAIVLDFVERCRRCPSSSDYRRRFRAEMLIIRSTQAAHFSPEISATLAQERPVRSSKLNAYRLFLDEDGLLRARTRLTEGPHFTAAEKTSIISSCYNIIGSTRILASISFLTP